MGKLSMDLYLGNMRKRYKSANRRQKGELLAELCAASGYHKKHAIRLLNKPSVPDDSTRNRKLSFQIVFMQLFRKSAKSLQISLNELFMNNYLPTPVTASAYTQARNKFKHTAFIELNNDMIDVFYFTDEMNADLHDGQYAKKINTAVSFNAIKHMAFDIFMNKTDSANAVEKMTRLFKMNPGFERVGREGPTRKNTSELQSFNFQKEPKNMFFNRFSLT